MLLAFICNEINDWIKALKSRQIEMTNKLKYLIIGTGRCGTGYFQKSFNNSGLNCGHENIFNSNDDDKNCQQYLKNQIFVAESSWAAAPYIDEPWFSEEIKIIHLIRNPVDVVRSFYELSFFSKERELKPLNILVHNNIGVSCDDEDKFRCLHKSLH